MGFLYIVPHTSTPREHVTNSPGSIAPWFVPHGIFPNLNQPTNQPLHCPMIMTYYPNRNIKSYIKSYLVFAINTGQVLNWCKKKLHHKPITLPICQDKSWQDTLTIANLPLPHPIINLPIILLVCYNHFWKELLWVVIFASVRLRPSLLSSVGRQIIRREISKQERGTT